MDNITRDIARFAAALRIEDIPKRTQGIATQIIVDTVACALGGSRCEAASMGRALAPPPAPGVPGGRVMITGELTTAESAAFINGCMIRFLDYNDSYPTGHPSDCTGALLALAAETDASGARLLTATVVAYEVYNRLTESARMRYLGWDQGAAIAVGVAAGLGNLLGLPEEQVAHAVSLAAVSCVPMRATRAGRLSLWKGAAGPHAAREATCLTQLAQLGMTGPEAPFEGRHGLWDLVTGPFEMRPFPPRGDFLTEKVRLKYWPLEYNIQIVVWAALELREKVRRAEIRSIDIGTYWSAWHETGSEPEKWAPQTRETADHSMPYIFARSYLDGGIDTGAFEREKFTDPGVLDFMRLISVHEDPDMEAIYPDVVACRVTVATASGEQLPILAENPRGHDLNRMTAEETSEKFLRLAAPVLPAPQAELALERWWDLASAASAARAVSLLSQAGD